MTRDKRQRLAHTQTQRWIHGGHREKRYGQAGTRKRNVVRAGVTRTVRIARIAMERGGEGQTRQTDARTREERQR